MGNVKAPSLHQTRQNFEGEDMVNLCKALNIAVGLIAQMSPMQINLLKKASKDKQLSEINYNDQNSSKIINNSGRIILFTSAKVRDLDQIQEFMVKSIEKCNNDIDAALRNDQL